MTARTETRGQLFARVALAAALGWASWLPWSVRGYVPMWDGRIYSDCVVAAAKHLTPSALRCAGHPSHAYIAILALAERAAVGSLTPILVANLLLLAAAGVAVWRLLRALAPDASFTPERLLIIAAVVVHPVVLANVVQPGLDFGSMVFLLWATVAAVERRMWWLVVFGLLAAFTKETGVIVYAWIAAVYALVHALPRPVPADLRNALLGGALGFVGAASTIPDLRVGVLIGLALGFLVFRVLCPKTLPSEWSVGSVVPRVLPLAPLAIPGVAFVGYLAYRAMLPRESVLWMGESSGSVISSLLSPQLGPTVRSYLALTLILGFLWLPSLVLLADLLVGVRRKIGNQGRRATSGLDEATLAVVTLVAVGGLYLLTRYVTFANARYLLPVSPLLLVLLVPAFVRLGVGPTARRAFLVVVVVLLGWSAARTVDPVSRALWGTFEVGEHRMLRITSLTGECCGAGRDQLVYNLEFTVLDALNRAALDRVQPVRTQRVISVSRYADWWILDGLGADSRRRIDSTGTLTRPYLHPELFDVELRQPGRVAPDTLWLFGAPNVALAPVVDSASASYAPIRPDTVRVGGYAMAIVPLVRRAGIDSTVILGDVARKR